LAIFAKRKEERQEEARRAAASQQLIEDIQSSFSADFRPWLERIAQAQTDTGSSALTEKILARIGPFPKVGINNSLTDMQVRYVHGVAQSHTSVGINRRRAQSINAAAEAEKSGKAGAVDDAVAYWDNVEAYIQEAIG
jgi:hypothetical protein